MAVRPPSIDTSNDPALTSGATSPTVASTQATINPDGTLARISNVPLTATTVVSNTSFVVTGNTTTVDSGDNVVVVTTDKDVFITVNEDNFAQNFINNDVNNIGGSEGEVQYNKDGNFAGDSTFTFNDTTKVLSVEIHYFMPMESPGYSVALHLEPQIIQYNLTIREYLMAFPE
jgi:hypothetical protein